MVFVRLKGGLGNQMFQYAAGRAVAHRKQVPLKLDVSWFGRQGLRSYALKHFNIVESFATPEEVARLTRRGRRDLWSRVYRRLQRCLPYYRRAEFSPRHNRYDPNILRVRDQVCLFGYWQSEKYFQDIESIIRKEFTFRNPPDQANQRMGEMIDATTSVSVHVRRGDYVTRRGGRGPHVVLPIEYYRRAVARLVEEISDPHFFVFSDDIEWVRDNFKVEHPVTIVDHNGAEKDYEDLRLMSRCKHHIIANSTFSWWGAWLCANPGKIVIAPQKWFKDPTRDTRDLIPPSWHRI